MKNYRVNLITTAHVIRSESIEANSQEEANKIVLERCHVRQDWYVKNFVETPQINKE